jgi:hypothetical protein
MHDSGLTETVLNKRQVRKIATNRFVVINIKKEYPKRSRLNFIILTSIKNQFEIIPETVFAVFPASFYQGLGKIFYVSAGIKKSMLFSVLL